jgi:hypothetical protein
LGLWNNPIESSWYQEAIFDACVCSSYKEKNILAASGLLLINLPFDL